MRLPNGTRVKWTGAGGGVRDYEGEIVGYVAAHLSLSIEFDERSKGWAGQQTTNRVGWARYVINTDDGLRTARASVIERQNRGGR